MTLSELKMETSTGTQTCAPSASDSSSQTTSFDLYGSKDTQVGEVKQSSSSLPNTIHVESDADSGIVALCSSIALSSSSASGSCDVSTSPSNRSTSSEPSSGHHSSSGSESGDQTTGRPVNRVNSICRSQDFLHFAPHNNLKRSNSAGTLNSTTEHANCCTNSFYNPSDDSSLYAQKNAHVFSQQIYTPYEQTLQKSENILSSSPTGSEALAQQQMRASCRKLLASLQPSVSSQPIKQLPQTITQHQQHLQQSIYLSECVGQCMSDKVIYENGHLWAAHRAQQIICQQQQRQQQMYATYQYDSTDAALYEQIRSRPNNIRDYAVPIGCGCQPPIDYGSPPPRPPPMKPKSNGKDVLETDSADELAHLLNDGRLIQQALHQNLSEEEKHANREQIRGLLLAAIHQKNLEREALEAKEMALRQRRKEVASMVTLPRRPDKKLDKAKNIQPKINELPAIREVRENQSNKEMKLLREKQSSVTLLNQDRSAQLMESVDPLESTESMVNAFASVALVDEPQSTTDTCELTETWVDGLDQLRNNKVMIRSISGSTLGRLPRTNRTRAHNSAGQLQVITEESRSTRTEDSKNSNNAVCTCNSCTDHNKTDQYIVEVPAVSSADKEDDNLCVQRIGSSNRTYSKVTKASEKEIEYAEIVCKRSSSKSKQAQFTQSLKVAQPNQPNKLDESLEDELITKSYHGGYCSKQTSEVLAAAMKKNVVSNRSFFHRFGASLSKAFNRAFHSDTTTSSKMKNDEEMKSNLQEKIWNGDTVDAANKTSQLKKRNLTNDPIELNLQDYCILSRPPLSGKRLSERSPGSVTGSRSKRTLSVKRVGNKCLPFGCTCRRCTSSNGIRKRNSNSTKKFITSSNLSVISSPSNAIKTSERINRSRANLRKSPSKTNSKSASEKKLRFQDSENSVLPSSIPSDQQVTGELVELNRDGSQIIELRRPKGKHFGFYLARGKVKNVNGVYVSRMRDEETQKMLNGLLEIGDAIIAIDKVEVKNLTIIEVNGLMTNKTKILLHVIPYVSSGRS